MLLSDVRLAAHRGLGAFRAQWRTSIALKARSDIKLVQPVGADLRRAYYFTSESGVYRVDRNGVYRVLDIPAYGIAIRGEWIFLALYSYVYSIVVRGNRKALHENGRRFDFQELFRLETLSTNERIHQVFLGDEALWVANTGRNTLVKIDPQRCRVIAELPMVVDRFDRAVLFDNHHINSVSEYGGTVLFTAYRAGFGRSLIGIYDGTSVTGFAYPREGVHDIYLSGDGFMLCDTFGPNTDAAGGILVTENGAFDPDFFETPPGCVVRGVAGTAEELLVGHSHKGTRSQRFNGHGSLLVARHGKVDDRIELPSAQVYQIVMEDGATLTPEPINVEPQHVAAKFQRVLGEPIYRANVEALSTDRQ